MSTPVYDIVIPIVNSKAKLSSKVPISLSKDDSIFQIRPDDLATITSQPVSGASGLNGATIAILFRSMASLPTTEQLYSKALAAVFTLNILSSANSAAIERAFVIKQHRKRSLSLTLGIGGLNQSASQVFSIDKSTDVSQAGAIFNAYQIAAAKEPSLAITANRFVTSMAKDEYSDRIIDIAICLESIFSATNEVSFKFSLYNSLLYSDHAITRRDVFKLLSQLYSYRSKIVHGEHVPIEAWLSTNWPTVLKVAKVVLLKKIDFLQTKSKSEWDSSLKDLALGINGAT